MPKVLIVDDERKLDPKQGTVSTREGLKCELEKNGWDAEIEMGRDDKSFPLATVAALANRVYNRIIREDFDALVMDVYWSGNQRMGFQVWAQMKKGLGLQMHERLVVFVSQHVDEHELQTLAKTNSFDPKQFIHKSGKWSDKVIEWFKKEFKGEEG